MGYLSKYSGKQIENILDNAVHKKELEGYARLQDIPYIPNKTSDLNNDSGFINSDAVDNKISIAIQPYATSDDVNKSIEEAINNISLPDFSDYVTENELKESIENIDIPESDYQSSISDKELTMPKAVGGLSAGTKLSDLEGKTYSQLFDEVLFPTIYPTYVSPSASISFKNYSSIQEVGTTAPTVDNFTVSFSRGAININGTKQADRAGALISGEVFCVGGSMPTSVSLGNTQYKYRANYAQGAQPKDNKGNNYENPLPSGSVESGVITLNGTYPWYIRDIKQTLVSWSASMSTGNFTLSATGVAEQIFKLPKALKELQMLNTISGKMEVISTSDWDVTNESINGITYYVYSYNGSARGQVTLLAKF